MITSKLIFTSKKFEGSIAYSFGMQDELMGIMIEAELSQTQRDYFLDHLPRTKVQLQSFVRATKQGELTSEDVDYTFDEFYEAYGFKRDRLRAEKIWNRMSRIDRIRAFIFIPKYESRRMRDGAKQKQPDGYLTSKPWMD